MTRIFLNVSTRKATALSSRGCLQGALDAEHRLLPLINDSDLQVPYESGLKLNHSEHPGANESRLTLLSRNSAAALTSYTLLVSAGRGPSVDGLLGAARRPSAKLCPLPCWTSPKPSRRSVVEQLPPAATTQRRVPLPRAPPAFPAGGGASSGAWGQRRLGLGSRDPHGSRPLPTPPCCFFLPQRLVAASGGGAARAGTRGSPLPAGRYRPAWRNRPLLAFPQQWPLASGPMSRGGLSGRGFSLRPPLGGEGAAFPGAALLARQPWGEGAAEGSGREVTGVSLFSFLLAFRLLQRSLLRPPPLSELCPLPAALPGACSVAAVCEPPGSGTGDPAAAAPAPRSAPCRGRGWRRLRALLRASAGGWALWRDRGSRDSGAGGGFFGKRLLPGDSQPAHGQSPAPW